MTAVARPCCVPCPAPGRGRPLWPNLLGPDKAPSAAQRLRPEIGSGFTSPRRNGSIKGFFFFFSLFILILLQSLSKNNPISLPQECSASEPWLPRPLCIRLAAAEQSHYRCHSVTLVKSTFGEGSAVASVWVGRGRDRWGAPGFLSRTFPRLWGGLSIPPSPLPGHLGLLASGSAVPAGVSRWRCSLAR